MAAAGMRVGGGYLERRRADSGWTLESGRNMDVLHPQRLYTAHTDTTGEYNTDAKQRDSSYGLTASYEGIHSTHGH